MQNDPAGKKQREPADRLVAPPTRSKLACRDSRHPGNRPRISAPEKLRSPIVACGCDAPSNHVWHPRQAGGGADLLGSGPVVAKAAGNSSSYQRSKRRTKIANVVPSPQTSSQFRQTSHPAAGEQQSFQSHAGPGTSNPRPASPGPRRTPATDRRTTVYLRAPPPLFDPPQNRHQDADPDHQQHGRGQGKENKGQLALSASPEELGEIVATRGHDAAHEHHHQHPGQAKSGLPRPRDIGLFGGSVHGLWSTRYAPAGQSSRLGSAGGPTAA